MKKSASRKSGSMRWASALAESATPLFVLDARRRLILFNRGCAEWTGWQFDELPAHPCDYATEADSRSPEAVLAACAPPAEVWQGDAAEVPGCIPHRTEPPRPGRIRFQPLTDDARKVVQVLGQFLPQKPSPSASPSAIPVTPSQLLHAELAALRHEIRSRYGEDSVIAQSPPMRRAISQLAAARQNTACVLFVGEPGTGREHLARVLHQHGPHSRQAFVPVDCRRSTSSELKLLLKQVFDERLEIEALRAGSLFFRDIEAAPRDVQERIALWLATKTPQSPPRILASTACSLSDFVERDEFHRELFFELTTLVIEVPRLADRPEEILPLAQFLLQELNRRAEKQLSGFNAEAAEALRRYRWPGNVAELKGVVEAAGGQAAGPLVTAADFPLSFRSGQDAQCLGPPIASPILPLDDVLEQVEREHLQAALRASRNNLSKAAELLGLSRPKLYRRLDALGLMPGGPRDETTSPTE